MDTRTVTGLLGAALVASLVWLALLLGGSVHASTADSGREFCGGSPTSVIRQGNGYLGGEYRSDQEAFDRRCVAAAHHQLELALVPGVLAVALTSGLVVLHRRQPKRPRTEPVQYSFR